MFEVIRVYHTMSADYGIDSMTWSQTRPPKLSV